MSDKHAVCRHPTNLHRVVVTGGIATGKSTLIEEIQARIPEVGIYDCDKAVHQLLTEEPVMARLRGLFGAQIFADSVLNRSALRQLVFADESCRRQLEDLIHPLVRSRCEEHFVSYAAERTEGLFIADVPLYFETHGAYPNDLVAVVATTRATQKRRLMQRSQLSSEAAESIISAQWPIEKKVFLGDVLIWNECPLHCLSAQAELFLSSLS
ncbi:MAG: dephospho-CoA kinase [Verrucomicrobiales bacterium]|jgi:dephospho-CoA kinase|nr:dephospho-CoA kinase [Verrucomicrobiales bacterium]